MHDAIYGSVGESAQGSGTERAFEVEVRLIAFAAVLADDLDVAAGDGVDDSDMLVLVDDDVSWPESADRAVLLGRQLLAVCAERPAVKEAGTRIPPPGVIDPSFRQPQAVDQFNALPVFASEIGSDGGFGVRIRIAVRGGAFVGVVAVDGDSVAAEPR